MELDSVNSALLQLETKATNFIINIKSKTVTLAEITKIEQELNKLRKEIEVLTPKYESLIHDLKNETEKNEILKKNHNALQAQLVNLEKNCADLRSCLIVGSSDNLKMIKAKELLNAGIKMTGIRWDFSAPDDVIKGYVANKSTGILKAFEMSKNNEDHQTELWDLIESVSTSDWTDVINNYCIKTTTEGKENVPSN